MDSASASRPQTANSADQVEGAICVDLEEIRRLTSAMDSNGLVFACHRCEDVSEPLVAIITIPEIEKTFGFCGPCYRSVSEEFYGPVA